MPRQLLTHGQWWSIISTHRSQMLQWWVLAGFISSQEEHFLFHIYLTSSTVFVLKRITFFNSDDSPSNLSLSSSFASFLLYLFLYCSLSFSIFTSSTGPFAFTIIAIVWLNKMLKPSIAPTQPHTMLNASPTLWIRITVITLRKASTCKYIK